MLGNRFACVKRPSHAGDDHLQMFIGRCADGRYEKADTSNTGGASTSRISRAFDGHPANAQHRNARGCTARRTQRVECGDRMTRIFGSGLMERAENEVIDPTRGCDRGGFLTVVHRPPYQRTTRQQRAGIGSADRIASEMHAGRIRRNRHVGSVIDHHFRAGPYNGRDTAPHEPHEIPRVEIPLAHVNEIDTRTPRCPDEIDEPIARSVAGGQAPSIGHHADHDCSIVSIVSMRRRARRTDASSLKPINRLTTPRPDTAPRR